MSTGSTLIIAGLLLLVGVIFHFITATILARRIYFMSEEVLKLNKSVRHLIDLDTAMTTAFRLFIAEAKARIDDKDALTKLLNDVDENVESVAAAITENTTASNAGSSLPVDTGGPVNGGSDPTTLPPAPPAISPDPTTAPLAGDGNTP